MLSTDDSKYFDIKGLSDFRILRTGVEGDGSCFLHSVFTCMNASCFMNLSREQRRQYVREQRTRISQELSIQEWSTISEGEVAINAFQLAVGRVVQTNMDKILKKKVQVDDKIYDTFVRYQRVLKDPNLGQIVNDSLSSNIRGVHNLQDFIVIFLNNLKKIDRELEEAFRIFSYEEIVKIEFNKFITYIDSSKYIDATLISLLSDKYNLNVVFINSDGSLKTPNSDLEGMMTITNNRPFILIYYISDTHFESIAQEIDGVNMRVFNVDSPVIRSLFFASSHRQLFKTDKEFQKELLSRENSNVNTHISNLQRLVDILQNELRSTEEPRLRQKLNERIDLTQQQIQRVLSKPQPKPQPKPFDYSNFYSDFFGKDDSRKFDVDVQHTMKPIPKRPEKEPENCRAWGVDIQPCPTNDKSIARSKYVGFHPDKNTGCPKYSEDIFNYYLQNCDTNRINNK